jgi:hypothetical protein
MNETKNPSSGMGLGVAGLVLGILSIPFGIMGCTFLLALVMGILGITLSAVGYTQARQANSATGLIIAAMIISIIGTSFALIRLTNSASKSRDVFRVWNREWKDRLEEYEEDSDEYSRSAEEAFRKGFKDEIEIEINVDTKHLEDELEQLEKELEQAGKEIERSLNRLSEEEKMERLGRATGKAVRKFMDELKDSTEN